MQADRYRIEVWLDPPSHTLTGRAAIDLRRADDPPLVRDPGKSGIGGRRRERPHGHETAIAFYLHPNLKVTRVSTGGVNSRYSGAPPGPPEEAAPFAPHKHLVILSEPVATLTLVVEYHGPLLNDYMEGDDARPRYIITQPHVGTDGIILAGGDWYPRPDAGEGAMPRLAEFTFIAKPVSGFALEAGAVRESAERDAESNRIRWRSPHPLEKLVLVGGPHVVHRETHRHVDIVLHLLPSQEADAPGLIRAVKQALDRYEPLVGPFPAREFKIVNNPLVSGSGGVISFPTFVLLDAAVFEMGEKHWAAPGFLDHQLLHAWWGNGVHVDPRDGNWCEPLTRYAADYYGHVLNGRPREARRLRRADVQFLSRVATEHDAPISEPRTPALFPQRQGSVRADVRRQKAPRATALEQWRGRITADRKGAMVFHMLADRIGQEQFWAAMRTFGEAHLGRYATWEDVRQACEKVSGVSLEKFFRQWVRESAIPELAVRSARFDEEKAELRVVLSQQPTIFDLNVPLRIAHADGTVDVRVALHQPTAEVTIPLSVTPLTVELDPEYDVLRKVSPKDIVPTTVSTRFGTAFAGVLPPGDAAEEYHAIRRLFESEYDDTQRIRRAAGLIEPGALASRNTLILGGAVHEAYVSGFLAAVDFPVRFHDDGFTFEDTRYDHPGHAVLCTVRHPEVEGGGITVIYANSLQALPSPQSLLMSDRSLVIFENRSPILERDFEIRNLVPVERCSN